MIPKLKTQKLTLHNMDVFLDTRKLARTGNVVYENTSVVVEKLAGVRGNSGVDAYLAIVPKDTKGGKPVVEIVLQKIPPKSQLIFVCNSLTIQGQTMLKKRGHTEQIDHDTVAFDKQMSALVPRYFVLGPSEIQVFEKTTGFQRKDLPKILSSDPMVKFLGMRPGQVALCEGEDVPRLVV